MKKIFINIFLAALFFVVDLRGHAQRPLPCGNGKIDEQAYNTALNYEKIHLRGLNINGAQTVNYLVRIYFHVFRLNDGSFAAATAAQIDAEFSTLLTSYSADAICFLNAGVEFHDNSSLDTNFNADNDPTGSALSSYQVLNCINVFYMQKIKGNNNACNPPCGYGGIALGGIPGTFCLVSTGNIGPGNTISHEVGHCLGLLHTFEPVNGHEDINGNNSASAADKITDTPADPFVWQGSGCYSTNASGCTYTGTCADPNAQTNYSPPYTNLMAYWWNGTSGVCVANPTATNGQFVRVNSFLNSNAPLISCSSPANVTISTINASSGYIMISAINTLTHSGTINITGTAKATLGGNTILLEPGFLASPAIGGLTRVIVKPCN